MSPALSSGFAIPSRTARALRPSVILTTVLMLLICGVMGMGIGIARFMEDRTEPLPVSVGACQAFMIMAVGSPSPSIRHSSNDRRVVPPSYTC